MNRASYHGWDEVCKSLRAFRDNRNWTQFHNPKDLACAISVEAGELLDSFRWSGEDTGIEGREESVHEELADVMIYCFYLADAIGVDPLDIITKKITLNEEHYPTDKALGNARKYTEL